MSNIEWTSATWNPVVGCTPVSPGCLNCYAATMARRLEAMGRREYAPRGGVHLAEVRGGRAVFAGVVRCLPERLGAPLAWRKPKMIFVNSMSDLFHESVPYEFVDRVFAVMALCPQHTFQVLTKRPERMAEYIDPDRHGAGMGHRLAVCAREVVGRTPVWPGGGRVEQARDYFDEHNGVLPNVWLGTSVERQAEADERIPHLLRCPAALRFLSCEPLLGPIDLDASTITVAPGFFGSCLRWHHRGKCHEDEGVDYPTIGWVIVGGESGPRARPCHIEHIRRIVDQCKAARVPCFVKQLGSRPWVVAVGDDPLAEWARERAWRVLAPDRPDDYLGDEAVFVWDDADGQPPIGSMVEVWLDDRKGGDPAEWPADLRVREMP